LHADFGRPSQGGFNCADNLVVHGRKGSPALFIGQRGGLAMDREDRELAMIRNLAVELIRLSHAINLPDDEDERTTEDAINIALVVRSLDRLCAHSVGGLARLVHFLTELQQYHDDDSREAH
jgi:hypothetical protein